MNIVRLLVLALFICSTSVLAHDQNSICPDVITPTPKILGGTESKQGNWPWMVALLESAESDIFYAQYCSGVLIDNNWVLTAAHCVVDQTTSSIDVAVGIYDLNNFSGSRIPVKRILTHPQYNDDLQNDIALLELSSPSNQPTIPLFSGKSGEEAPLSLLGRILTAIGWGMMDGGSFPSRLRQVDLPVVEDSYCNNIYPDPALIPSQLCAGYYEGKDVCNGDSGGPVVTQIDEQWVHVGLVSFGSPCNTYNGWYGAYTRTSAYVDFINQYVAGAQYTREYTPSLHWLPLLLD